jgi:hypothetical protein
MHKLVEVTKTMDDANFDKFIETASHKNPEDFFEDLEVPGRCHD